MLTIDEIKGKGWLVYEVVAGSKAYGLDTPASDTDIRGVFVLPEDEFFGLNEIEQVSNETNDIVYYELKKFMELLLKNNPNILELVSTPEQFILQKHPMIDAIKPGLFLSKLCEKSFANYAFTQIKKASGRKKKIVNPVEKERKSILDFCFVYKDKRSIALKEFLEDNGLQQEHVGLSAISHLRDCYNMFYAEASGFKGVCRNENANDVCLSSVAANEKPVGMLYFNKDGYSMYCKSYKEYWNWVDKRNEERYTVNMAHGKNYDAKNMMHVFRLLLMAKEIAEIGKMNVNREDREFLLAIKRGEFEYDDLLEQANRMMEELPALYQQSGLPEEPSKEKINQLLVKMRKDYYGLSKAK